tara:strand:+ start:224 stop:682 length:459 start_codon:yes stop_codon:yes gene_type:complete
MIRQGYLNVLICSILLLCAGCSSEDQTGPIDNSNLYGVWVANYAYSIVITKDEKYVFCSSEECVTGKVDRPNDFYIWLVDFYNHPLAMQFALNAHKHKQFITAETGFRKKAGRPNDLNFSNGRCGDIPCMGFGDKENGVDFKLVKSFSKSEE